MATIVKPHTFTAGTTILSAQVNSDFDTVYTDYNGNITNANISGSAAIVDTKLAQISTADKVAITALGTISGLTEKTSLTGNDLFLINDSADSNAKKKVKFSNMSFTPTAANALAGSVVQVVSTQTGAVSTGTTVIPDDDTIPQNTEGDEYMTLAITPTSATNKLYIQVIANGACSVSQQLFGALFQDSTAGALVAGAGDNTANQQGSFSLEHYMTSGTTSSTTFKVRMSGAGGTFTFNGAASARKFGGVMGSGIRIMEIKV